jgi:hypothetical protein
MESKSTFYIFFGHDYFNKKKGRYLRYRNSIERALERINVEYNQNILPLYGNSPLSPEIKSALAGNGITIQEVCTDYYWPRILAFIKISAMVVMDLRPHSRPKELINLNVLLELGASYNKNVPHIILANDRDLLKDRLTNINGVTVDVPPDKNLDKYLFQLLSSRLVAMMDNINNDAKR